MNWGMFIGGILIGAGAVTLVTVLASIRKP